MEATRINQPLVECIKEGDAHITTMNFSSHKNASQDEANVKVSATKEKMPKTLQRQALSDATHLNSPPCLKPTLTNGSSLLFLLVITFKVFVAACKGCGSSIILEKICKAIKLIIKTTSLTKTGIFVLAVASFSSFTGSCLALRVNYVNVPHYQKSGDPVNLECNFDLEGKLLYSVKWYRGSHEFFRYVPGDHPPMQVFDLEGVIVDTSLSDSTHVTLRPVTRKSSGKYKCEVSADAPSFHTASDAAEMLVVDLPESVPNITGSHRKYHVGDEVHVNCSSKSRPASSLKWYINGKAVMSEKLVEYAPEKADDELEISRLGLKFIVGTQDFPNGILKIKCSATTAAVYYQSTEEAVEGHLPQTSPALESKGVYTGGTRPPFPQALSSGILVLQVLLYLMRFSTL